MSLVSSPTSPHRAGSVPWVSRRPPYAILASEYGSRRPAATSRCFSQSNLPPPTPSTFPRFGAPRDGRNTKTHVTAVAARSFHRARRRRHRASRLASYSNCTGPETREFLAPATRRWGASCIFRKQSWFHRTRGSRPMPKGAGGHTYYFCPLRTQTHQTRSKIQLGGGIIGSVGTRELHLLEALE